MKISKGTLAILIIVLLVIIDQVVKIYIKTHFYLGEDVKVTDWFYIYFIQNPGMAFGMQLGNKMFLSIFRIVAVVFFGYYLTRLSRMPQIPNGYIACVALVTAGALGNIIDCCLYGLIFNNPMPPQVAEFVPVGTGYASFLHGQVVDMLYFPLCSWDWPSWIPFIGGQHFVFFHPVFNIADAGVSVGIIAAIIFYSKYIGVFHDIEDPTKTAGQN